MVTFTARSIIHKMRIPSIRPTSAGRALHYHDGFRDRQFTTGFLNDTVSLGGGNDTVNTSNRDASVDGGTGTDHWLADLSQKRRTLLST